MNAKEIKNLSYTFVIFGGTGDLTHRKIIPALYNLERDLLLPVDFSIIVVGRRDYSRQTYIDEAIESIKEFSRIQFDPEIWGKLEKRIHYKQLDFLEIVGYSDFSNYLSEMEATFKFPTQRIYYLAVAPEFFEIIVENLKVSSMNNLSLAPRVVIEKPFGRDLTSARYLNDKIVETFGENNTYRIDHYLGKEMLQNIMFIRFANTIFEPIWNNKYIEQIQILSSETLGIGSRGGYYDKAGQTRDMLQSHLLQLLSLITMEEPNDLNTETIRDEKVKILKSLKKYDFDEINKYVVRGQYGSSELAKAYKDEAKVEINSNTETFVALKVFLENDRWKDVPIYIRTGKRMKEKTTEIIIQFKKLDKLYKTSKTKNNTLVFKIQPEEGVFFQFNAKKPGADNLIIPVKMDFCQNCQVGYNSPEAYERLIFDVMRGDATLFARWDEVEYSWEFVDKIFEAWKNEDPHFPNYIPGTNGPASSDLLVSEDNHTWLDSSKEMDDENL